MNEHYAAVLADLQERRYKLEAELREIDVMIAGLKRLAGDEPPPAILGSPAFTDLTAAINKLPGVNIAPLSY